jgi:hypothetical protein
MMTVMMYVMCEHGFSGVLEYPWDKLLAFSGRIAPL